ncbi:MAG: sensor domain-containing diguanylate cyclase [Panacagrimonas sp.]
MPTKSEIIVIQALQEIFSNRFYIPHGYCLAWNPLLLWSLVIANSVIGLSYFSIPFGLRHFAKKQGDRRFNPILLMFGLFIFACGTTHFISVLSIWYPFYKLDAVVLIITAVLSLFTALSLRDLIPKALTALEQRRLDQVALETLNERLQQSLAHIEEQKSALAESENFQRLLVNNAPIGLASVALDGHFTSVNYALYSMLGYREKELLNLSFQEITHPDDLQADLALLKTLMDGTADSYRMHKRYLHKRGHEIYVQLDAGVIRDAERNPVRFVAQIQDVSESRRVEMAEQEAKAKLAASVSQLSTQNEQIQTLGALGETLQTCENLEEIAAPIRNLLPQMFPAFSGRLYLLNASRSAFEVVADWGGMEVSDEMFSQQACWAIRKNAMHWTDSRDGLCCKHLHEQAGASPGVCVPLAAQGETLGLLFLRTKAEDPVPFSAVRRSDIERLASMTADRIAIAVANIRLSLKLRQQSIRDSLTGLFNRRYLEESLEREAARTQREKTSLALLMIDVDHFKKVNDGYGHDVGDRVLAAIARALSDACRRSDVVCRYGGEEFTVLLPNTTQQQAMQAAENLRQAVRRIDPGLLGGLLTVPTISVGVAYLPLNGNKPAAVLKAADKALHVAKTTGRDRVVSAPLPGEPGFDCSNAANEVTDLQPPVHRRPQLD